jgi:hypothetical protein
MNKALEDIAAERLRQQEGEGFTYEHDDQCGDGTLAVAGACYAVNGAAPDIVRSQAPAGRPPYMWPWGDEWWKPKSRRHDLVRGAALIVAQIEMLDRAFARWWGQVQSYAEMRGVSHLLGGQEDHRQSWEDGVSEADEVQRQIDAKSQR